MSVLFGPAVVSCKLTTTGVNDCGFDFGSGRSKLRFTKLTPAG